MDGPLLGTYPRETKTSEWFPDSGYYEQDAAMNIHVRGFGGHVFLSLG